MTRVWLGSDAWASMCAEAASQLPRETGGILFGYWAAPLEEAVVTDSIGPGPRARHDEDFFQPDAAYQEKQMARLYENSRRRFAYLGDWHSHPKGEAYMSRMDRNTGRRIARHRPARAPYPLMAVLANSEQWSIRVWRYRRGVAKRGAQQWTEMSIETYASENGR